MTQHHFHYVDFPSAVTLNGSVVKVTFGSGSNPEAPDETHTLAMPIGSFIALSKHLYSQLQDDKFKDAIKREHKLVAAEFIKAEQFPKMTP